MSHRLISYLFVFIPYISCTMEQDPSIQNYKKIELIQELYKSLGKEKTLEECSAIQKQAEGLDQLAKTIGMPHCNPIHAPWRDSYKTQEREHDKPQPIQEPQKITLCPFCDQFSQPHDDGKNFIIERNDHCVVMFNRNPYLPLHFLIIPYSHIAKLELLKEEERQDVLQQAALWLKKLKKLFVGGANIYFNLESKSAGASIPDHIHGQLLSRWDGDDAAITYLITKDIIAAERDHLLSAFSSQDHEKTQLTSVFSSFAKLLFKEHQHDSNRSCYICNTWKEDTLDQENLVIHRFDHWLLLLHRFGYAGGHLLLVSKRHGTTFDTLNREESKEFDKAMNLSQTILKSINKPDGLNIVINDGICSGNCFNEHVCCNIIPRIVNDTSATAVICGRPIMEKNVDILRNRFMTMLAATILTFQGKKS